MSIALQRFANGDTNYVAKLDSNCDILEGAVNALQGQLSAQSATVNLPNLYVALFGSQAAVVGSTSYGCTAAGLVVTVAAGLAWLPSLGAVVQAGSSHPLDFTGQPDGTYYITADSTGTPFYQTISTDALYQVVKAASVLTITRVAAVTWAQSDWLAAQSSSRFGTFLTLDARLENIEASVQQLYIAGGFLAGKPGNAALMFAVLPTVTATFVANFVGSRAKSGVAATASTVLNIKKNGLVVGTITFGAGQTAGVFAAAAPTVVGATDELTIENQAVADATLADVRFALHGTR